MHVCLARIAQLWRTITELNVVDVELFVKGRAQEGIVAAWSLEKYVCFILTHESNCKWRGKELA